MAEMPVTFGNVLKACERIAPYLNRTPVFTCSTADEIAGRKLFFKAENLQKTGSFKARGALNAILLAKERKPTVAGIVTHSSGNHGQAVAWASKRVNLPSYVVVPAMAPASKKTAIRGYGAQLIECGSKPSDRYEACDKLQAEKDLEMVPPFDHPDVIAGQGSIAVELLDQVPDLDAIMVPISGGGMASGIAIAAKHMKPDIKVFVVSPQGKLLTDCFKSGQRLWPNPPEYLNTTADAIRLQQLGHLTFNILSQLAEKDAFEMSDEEMIQGVKFIMHRMKLVVEMAAGASVAAVLSDRMKSLDPAIKKVGVILCGGNIDLDNLPW
ncbi:serine racemase-like [Littorina saxatilis]|uniref:Serine racemase n=1 Tax=Littorina saxatilis TaxID=31220 RepID=A0AAN9AI81_9CAEN